MKKNTFICEMCKGKFEKGWSDEEAEKETIEMWGNLSKQDRAVVCDDCFKVILS